MDLGLTGKSVIVTGGASNIGRAIVLTYAQEHAKITLADLDVEQGEQVAALALEAGAESVQVVKTDVTKLSDVEFMVGQAIQCYGGVDVLVNNVGWDKLQYFSETGPEFWQKIIEVNFVGMLNCTKTVLEPMVQNKGGSIVSISSDASRQGEAREAVYGGMKAATNSLMKSIAKENGRYGVRCNCVCPGVTVPDTDAEMSANSMWQDKSGMFTDEQFGKIAKSLPLKRLGKGQDIANAVVFLSSQKAAGYVTGQVLSVSGGYTMIG